MPAVAAQIACAMVLAALPAGCGSDVRLPDQLSGSSVGSMAERELETENPRLAHGSLSCPALDLRVGASVRCLRTTAFGDGRIVKVRGTVRVTSLASGGRLHVAMDTEATEFGVSGDRVATELRGQARHLFHRSAGSVDCPYLRGQVGARSTCDVRIGHTQRVVDAVVTDVDAEQYDVRYSFRPHPLATPTPAS
ncbi:MAG: hypothetical protein JF565_03375 [Propionibacteriales bacterium]|nr:hypothetical protein [Propionibacteriales bacterium]